MPQEGWLNVRFDTPALEQLTVPVVDVERSWSFYVDQVGFSVEQDQRIDETHQFVELTPPGSRCSIAPTDGCVDSLPAR